MLVIWLPIGAILTLVLMRPFKGVMLAMQFHNRPRNTATMSGEAPRLRP